MFDFSETCLHVILNTYIYDYVTSKGNVFVLIFVIQANQVIGFFDYFVFVMHM